MRHGDVGIDTQTADNLLPGSIRTDPFGEPDLEVDPSIPFAVLGASVKDATRSQVQIYFSCATDIFAFDTSPALLVSLLQRTSKYFSKYFLGTGLFSQNEVVINTISYLQEAGPISQRLLY